MLALDVFLARQSASANSYSPDPYVANTENSDSPSYNPSPQATYSPDASYTSERWGVSKIEAPQAWQITRGDRSIIVAVLDTGIDKDNPDLADKVVAEVNLPIARRAMTFTGTVPTWQAPLPPSPRNVG